MTMCDHYEGMRENCSKKSFFHTLEGLQGLIFWLRGQHFEPIALRTLSHRLMHRTRNIEGRKAYFIGYMTNRLLLGIEPSRKRVLFIVKVSVTLSPCGCLIFLILFVILMEAKHFEYFFLARFGHACCHQWPWRQGFLGRNPEDDRDHFGKKRLLWHDWMAECCKNSPDCGSVKTHIARHQDHVVLQYAVTMNEIETK